MLKNVFSCVASDSDNKLCTEFGFKPPLQSAVIIKGNGVTHTAQEITLYTLIYL